MTYAMHTLKAPSNLVYLSDCIERAILRSVLFNIFMRYAWLSLYVHVLGYSSTPSLIGDYVRICGYVQCITWYTHNTNSTLELISTGHVDEEDGFHRWGSLEFLVQSTSFGHSRRIRDEPHEGDRSSHPGR